MDWERESCTVTAMPVAAVDERDGGGDLVDVPTAAGTGRAREGFREVRLADAEALHAALKRRPWRIAPSGARSWPGPAPVQ